LFVIPSKARNLLSLPAHTNLDVNSGKRAGALPPVVRQIKINGDTLLVLGKPIVIGSVDDPNSNKQFQLEVTVTKLK
jgi:hypothetical protein